MRSYLIGIAVLSLALLSLSFLEVKALNLHPFFPWVIVFYFFQSLLVSWLLHLGEKDRSRFALFALGSLSLRLVTALFFLLMLILLELEKLEDLIIQFTVVYLCYLTFEMILVFSNLRRNSGKNLPK